MRIIFPCRTLVVAITCAISLVASAGALQFGFSYGGQKVRGVSLSGRLVLEPWITPSIFDSTHDPRIVDEYTYGQYQNHAQALVKLQHHWNTFITEADIAAISAAGLNHVRIPIGFWAFDLRGGEPYIQGQLPYLKKAVTWAQKYNLKVLISLGAPGSQNAYTGLTGKASTFSAAYMSFLGEMWQLQAAAYEDASMEWIQNTWKTENADEWYYQAGLANGWIPQNPAQELDTSGYICRHIYD